MILVVEDNEGLGRIYARALQAAGFATRWVTTGRAGLDLLSDAIPRPEVVIVDLALPDTDGVTFAEAARRAGYDGPIVAMSGALDLMDREKIAAAEFAAEMRKPLRLAELTACVRRWAKREPFPGDGE